MITSEEFRLALRHFPAGVTIVTIKTGDQRHGLTVSAFASVSAEPPMIMVIIENRHMAYSMLQEPDAVFAVRPEDLLRVSGGRVVDLADATA